MGHTHSFSAVHVQFKSGRCVRRQAEIGRSESDACGIFIFSLFLPFSLPPFPLPFSFLHMRYFQWSLYGLISSPNGPYVCLFAVWPVRSLQSPSVFGKSQKHLVNFRSHAAFYNLVLVSILGKLAASFFLSFVHIQFIYKAVIISAVQQSDPVVHRHITILSEAFPTEIITEYWVEFSVLYSRAPVVPIYLRVHIWLPSFVFLLIPCMQPLPSNCQKLNYQETGMLIPGINGFCCSYALLSVIFGVLYPSLIIHILICVCMNYYSVTWAHGKAVLLPELSIVCSRS